MTEDIEPNILKYPTHSEDYYPLVDDRLVDVRDMGDVESPLKPMFVHLMSFLFSLAHRSLDSIGQWTGRITHQPEFDAQGAIAICSFRFHTCDSGDRLIASPILQFPWACTHVDVSATCSREENDTTVYSVTITYNSGNLMDEYYRLYLSPDGNTLAGKGCFSQDVNDPNAFTVTMKRDVPPEIMAFYPTSVALEENKARALWKFATDATLFQVQQRNFSTRFVRSRLEKRRRLASLSLRRASGPLHPDDVDEFAELLRNVTPAELHAACGMSMEPHRFPYLYSACGIQGSTIGCGRVLRSHIPCLRCCSSFPSPTMMCGNPECLATYNLSCVVKTRVLEWSASIVRNNLDGSTTFLTPLALRVADRIAALNSHDYLWESSSSIAETDTDYAAPHLLSPISERTELDDDFSPVASGRAPSGSSILRVSPPLPALLEEIDDSSSIPASDTHEDTHASTFYKYSEEPEEIISPSLSDPDSAFVTPEVTPEERSPSLRFAPSVTVPAPNYPFGPPTRRRSSLDEGFPEKCTCIGCDADITLPSWMCVECTGEYTFHRQF